MSGPGGRHRPPRAARSHRQSGAAGTFAAWVLPCVIPTLCGGWVLDGASSGDIAAARRIGAASAGLLFLSIAFVGPVIARGVWRDLQAYGVVSQGMACGVPARALAGRTLWLAAGRMGEALGPWVLLPCVLAGLGGWSASEALALAGCAGLYAGLAGVAGLVTAWTDRPGRERPAAGIVLLALLSAPGVLVALRAVDPLHPTDLAGWSARALARATPLGALRPAWAAGPAAPWVAGAVATWAIAFGALLVAALILAPLGARATRALEFESA